MEELELSEEETKLILFFRALKLKRENKNYSSVTPNEVNICVTEDLSLGEKIGG